MLPTASKYFPTYKSRFNFCSALFKQALTGYRMKRLFLPTYRMERMRRQSQCNFLFPHLKTHRFFHIGHIGNNHTDRTIGINESQHI